MSRSVFLSALLSLMLCAAGFAEELRIGVILPLTGPNGFGGGARGGCQLALEALERDSARHDRVRIFFEDDQYAPAKTVTALQKLLQIERINAVVAVSSGPARAILPIIKRRRIPLLAIATNDGFTLESPYAHSLWMAPAIEAGAIFDEIKRRGYKRVARITDENPVFLELNRVIDGLNRGTFDLVLDEHLSPDQDDLRSVLAKLRALPAVDAVALNVLAAHAGRLAREIRAARLKPDLFAPETFETPEALKLAAGALEGQWYASSADPDPGFVAEFRRRFPNELLIGAANCHDAVMLLAAGYQAAHGAAAPVPERINNYLKTVRGFHGALGTLSAGRDGTFSIPAAIRRVRGEGYVQERVYP